MALPPFSAAVPSRANAQATRGAAMLYLLETRVSAHKLLGIFHYGRFVLSYPFGIFSVIYTSMDSDIYCMLQVII